MGLFMLREGLSVGNVYIQLFSKYQWFIVFGLALRGLMCLTGRNPLEMDNP